MVYFAGNSVAVGIYSENNWLGMGLCSFVASWAVGRTVFEAVVPVAVAPVAAAKVAAFAAFEA